MGHCILYLMEQYQLCTEVQANVQSDAGLGKTPADSIQISILCTFCSKFWIWHCHFLQAAHALQLLHEPKMQLSAHYFQHPLQLLCRSPSCHCQLHSQLGRQHQTPLTSRERLSQVDRTAGVMQALRAQMQQLLRALRV